MLVSLEFPGSKWPIDTIRPQMRRRRRWRQRCGPKTGLWVYGRWRRLQATDSMGLWTKSYQRPRVKCPLWLGQFGRKTFGAIHLDYLYIYLLTQYPGEALHCYLVTAHLRLLIWDNFCLAIWKKSVNVPLGSGEIWFIRVTWKPFRNPEHPKWDLKHKYHCFEK